MIPKTAADLETLLALYGKRKHPLEYGNRYQLAVMVILSARDSDRHINALAPRLFAAYPDVPALAAAREGELLEYVGEVTNGVAKAQWLIKLAKTVKTDDALPRRMADLLELSGIGRKSANVIIRESGDEAEGIVVDLHVLRTAPRIGLAAGTQPERIEKQLMAFFPRERWNEAGMALSFLGRETCRPSYPKCAACPVSAVCDDAAARRA